MPQPQQHNYPEFLCPKNTYHYWKETVKSGTGGITPKPVPPVVTFCGHSSSHFLGPTSRAGTLQLDAAPNPHPVARLEEIPKHHTTLSSYSESSVPDRMNNRWNLAVWRQDP
jgi:hypothetical protein